MVFLEAPYDSRWEVSIGALRVGDSNYFKNKDHSAFYFDSKKAVFDSFSPVIKLPNSIQNKLI